MLAAAVVIDVVPADAPAELAAVMVEACSSGVPKGACVLSKDAPESTRPAAVAVVVWQGAGFGDVTVRVGQPNGEWASRQLTFAEADPERDRWVTVGLTVAGLVEQAQSDEAPAVAPPAAPAKSPVAPPTAPPAKPAPSKSVQLGLSAGALVGNGWDAGKPLFGGWATLALSFWEQRLIALGGASLAFSSGPHLVGTSQASSRWLAAELGLGPQFRVAPFRFFVAPELALQTVEVELGAGESRSDRELELKLRAGATWAATQHWGLTLGGATRLLPVQSPSGDPTRARRSGFSGEVLAGIELVP